MRSIAQSVFIGDFDRDGNLDVALLGRQFEGSQSVAVLLGNGDGTFQSQKTYALGTNTCSCDPQQVMGGDLNGDGVLDLVVTADPGIIVLLGRGDGTFSAPTVFSELQGTYVTLADLNGDGKLDAVVSSSTSHVSVALGKGDGTFETPQAYQVPGAGSSPVVADINQDGKLDIALEQSSVGGIQVLSGLGDGSFQPAMTYLPTKHPASVLITGDFNGDGRTDLLDVNPESDKIAPIFNGQATDMLLAKEELGPGTTTVQASFPGDEAFTGSSSNRVILSPNGTPPPQYTPPNYFNDLSDLNFDGSAVYSNADGFVALTTGLKNQAGSIFYAAPQNIQAFTTDFQYEVTGPADGLTFTIQNAGPNALGGPGGGLGYRDIVKSVAVKFDVYNNGGEGDESVGLYVDGASPGLPAVSVPGFSNGLHSIVAHIAYDGTTLTLTIYDPQHEEKTFTQSWPIDIPATVGGPTAYVGFTGGTGSLVSAIELLTWAYSPGMP